MSDEKMSRPILFSGEMVRAILDGRKTQTRRIVKPQPEPIPDGVPRMERYDSTGYWWASNQAGMMVSLFDAPCLCPHGYKKDKLWVKETFAKVNEGSPDQEIVWAADRCASFFNDSGLVNDRFWKPSAFQPKKWKPSIFMPRWASRITLEITEVRVERLNAISEEDSWAEGVTLGKVATGIVCESTQIKEYVDECPSEAYERLWESINGPGSWAKNPWVWAISFKRV